MLKRTIFVPKISTKQSFVCFLFIGHISRSKAISTPREPFSEKKSDDQLYRIKTLISNIKLVLKNKLKIFRINQ